MYELPRPAATVMFFLLASLAAQPGAGAQEAQHRPSRPVRIIVPFAPGGATDLISRLLQQRLVELWGQPVVVDNRPGASGLIAFTLAAQAPPDGHTLLTSSVSITILETTLARTLKMRPLRDLVGVTNLIMLPHLFVVHPALPAASLKELIEHARRTGARLNYATSAVGTYTHLDAIQFRRAAGLDITIVPYKGGAGQFLAAVVSNEAQMMLVNMASSLPHVRAGRLKALATTWPQRRPELPEVPTMAESGFPGVGTNAWNGLFTPAGVPRPLLARIHADVVSVLAGRAMQEQLAKQHMSAVPSRSPAEFAEFLREEAAKWRRIVVENQIVVE